MKSVAVHHFPAIVLHLCLVVVLIAFACSGHPAIATAQRNPATSISLSTPLTISPVEQKEWYEKGNWPLFGSVLTVLITNLIAVGVVYLTANRTLQGLLKQKKLERVTASLNEFYNPLKALLEANRVIFSKTGPRSWPTEHIEREAAALVWAETKLKILENNKAIELILQTKTHLIDESDSLEKYADLYAGWEAENPLFRRRGVLLDTTLIFGFLHEPLPSLQFPEISIRRPNVAPLFIQAWLADPIQQTSRAYSAMPCPFSQSSSRWRER